MIEINAEQQREQTMLGRYRKQVDGGTLFEYCMETMELRKAEIQFEDVVFGKAPKRRILTKPKCLYVEALNESNAIKRLKRGSIILST